MAKLFIHIGTHKTGTTAIQKALAHSRASLAKEKIHVLPRHPAFLDAQLGLTVSSETVEQISRHIEKEARKHVKAKAYVLSYEGFSGDMRIGYANANSVAKAIGLATEKFETHIIVYLRRQDTFIESAYLQSIKEGDSWSFSEFISRRGPQWFNWDSLLSAYSTSFPSSPFSVRRYEKQLLPTSDSLIDDFANIIGSAHLRKAPFGRPNPGLKGDTAEVLRICNTQFDAEKKRHLRTMLQRAAGKAAFDNYAYFDATQRVAILQEFRSSNQKVAAKYFGGIESGELFTPPTLDDCSTSHKDLTIDSLAMLMMRIAIDLDSQVTETRQRSLRKQILSRAASSVKQIPRAARRLRQLLLAR